VTGAKALSGFHARLLLIRRRRDLVQGRMLDLLRPSPHDQYLGLHIAHLLPSPHGRHAAGAALVAGNRVENELASRLTLSGEP
jgi:hypothetical protein